MLKAKEILQIDGTIIAGLLIFATFIFVAGENIEPEPKDEESFFPVWDNFVESPKAWSYGIGIFFVVSAFSAVIMSVKEDQGSDSGLYTLSRFISITMLGMGFFVFLVAFYKVGW